MGEIMRKQPAAAPAAAMSHMAVHCFHLAHDATGDNREHATRTTIAATKLAKKRTIRVIGSGVPIMSAAGNAVTAAGRAAFFITVLIASSDLSPPNAKVSDGSQPPM